MPARKADITIRVSVGDRSISLNCVRAGTAYIIKRGRSISRKMPTATLTDIFETARKWAVNNA